MPLTHKYSVVAMYWRDKLDAARGDLQLTDVWYGDQLLVPRVPACAIETGPYVRELNHLGMATENRFSIYFMVYHGKVQDVQLTKLECDQRSEAIMDFLHTDKQAGGLVVNGFVVAIDPGFVVRNNVLFKVNRIMWEGLSKTTI